MQNNPWSSPPHLSGSPFPFIPSSDPEKNKEHHVERGSMFDSPYMGHARPETHPNFEQHQTHNPYNMSSLASSLNMTSIQPSSHLYPSNSSQFSQSMGPLDISVNQSQFFSLLPPNSGNTASVFSQPPVSDRVFSDHHHFHSFHSKPGMVRPENKESPGKIHERMLSIDDSVFEVNYEANAEPSEELESSYDRNDYVSHTEYIDNDYQEHKTPTMLSRNAEQFIPLDYLDSEFIEGEVFDGDYDHDHNYGYEGGECDDYEYYEDEDYYDDYNYYEDDTNTPFTSRVIHESHYNNSNTNQMKFNGGTGSYADVTKANVVDQYSYQAEAYSVPKKICLFFLQDSCKYGSSCNDSHNMGVKCNLCQSVFCSALEASSEVSMAHMEVCPEMKIIREERQSSFNYTCNLCDRFPIDRYERYGILTSCDHAFCLSCIKNYRRSDGYEKDDVRKCPVCKVVSHYVIPCDRFIINEKRKEKLIQQFQTSLSTIPCIKFDNGYGVCPFGISCFYAHVDETGKKSQYERPRFVYSANSCNNEQVLNESTFSDYINWNSCKKTKTKKKGSKI